MDHPTDDKRLYKVDVITKFWDPLYISGSSEAVHFKLCTQTDCPDLAFRSNNLSLKGSCNPFSRFGNPWYFWNI